MHARKSSKNYLQFMSTWKSTFKRIKASTSPHNFLQFLILKIFWPWRNSEDTPSILIIDIKNSHLWTARIFQWSLNDIKFQHFTKLSEQKIHIYFFYVYSNCCDLWPLYILITSPLTVTISLSYICRKKFIVSQHCFGYLISCFYKGWIVAITALSDKCTLYCNNIILFNLIKFRFREYLLYYIQKQSISRADKWNSNKFIRFNLRKTHFWCIFEKFIKSFYVSNCWLYFFEQLLTFSLKFMRIL